MSFNVCLHTTLAPSIIHDVYLNITLEIPYIINCVPPITTGSLYVIQWVVVHHMPTTDCVTIITLNNLYISHYRYSPYTPWLLCHPLCSPTSHQYPICHALCTCTSYMYHLMTHTMSSLVSPHDTFVSPISIYSTCTGTSNLFICIKENPTMSTTACLQSHQGAFMSAISTCSTRTPYVIKDVPPHHKMTLSRTMPSNVGIPSHLDAFISTMSTYSTMAP